MNFILRLILNLTSIHQVMGEDTDWGGDPRQSQPQLLLHWHAVWEVMQSVLRTSTGHWSRPEPRFPRFLSAFLLPHSSGCPESPWQLLYGNLDLLHFVFLITSNNLVRELLWHRLILDSAIHIVKPIWAFKDHHAIFQLLMNHGFNHSCYDLPWSTVGSMNA